MKRKELKDQLRSIKHEAIINAQQENADTIWQKDVDAIDEVLDILEDYDKQAEQIRMLTKRHATPIHALKKGDGVYVCPVCNHYVTLRSNYCQRCGQMLRKPERRAAVERDLGLPWTGRKQQK